MRQRLVVLGVLGISVAVAIAAVLAADLARSGEPPQSAFAPTRSLWLSADEIAELPTSGRAWTAVRAEARGSYGDADVSDSNSQHDVKVLAGALVAARTGDQDLRRRVADGVEDAIGTEVGGSALALGRNLTAYVIAADLIDLRGLDGHLDARFSDWLGEVVDEDLDGDTLVSIHERRPNNWGLHAGAARLAAALYLEDMTSVDQVARVLRGWVGDRQAYDGFEFGDLDWQSDPTRPVGINPAGATIDGHDVDGVLPDEQRRSGGFEWPPPCENYVREGMQGLVVQAELLDRTGIDAWAWGDRAILRAAEWLLSVDDCEFDGDDGWIVPILNVAYRIDLPHGTVRSGKNMGFTDWTHDSTRLPPVEPTPSPTPTGHADHGGRCTVTGTAADERLVGSRAADVVCGRGGDDRLIGRGGNDVLRGGPGDDVLLGGRSRDVLVGGRGDDRLRGGPGIDAVIGGQAGDTVVGGIP